MDIQGVIRQMATKRRVKKNIKEDPLVTYTLRTSKFAQEHFNIIIIGVVVLVGAIAILVFNSNSRKNAAVQAQRQLASAMALYQQRDFESAKTSFEQVYSGFKGPKRLVAKYFKAECEMKQRNYGQALIDYDLYLDDASKFPTFKEAALFAKALCYEGLENYSQAAIVMETLHQSMDEDDPRYLDAAYQAGEFFAKAGDNDRAAIHFRTVSEKGSGELKDKATIATALLGR
jgi:tetratricopeptide (TPR) repeat protein